MAHEHGLGARHGVVGDPLRQGGTEVGPRQPFLCEALLVEAVDRGGSGVEAGRIRLELAVEALADVELSVGIGGDDDRGEEEAAELLTFGLHWILNRATGLMGGALQAMLEGLPVVFLLGRAVDLVMLTLGAVVSTVTYLHLRSVDEQVSEPDLLAVFD